MSDKHIEEFVEEAALAALQTLLTATDEEEVLASVGTIAGTLGVGSSFSRISAPDGDGERKLIASFHKNLVLLIQKTWVEKSDEELKAQVLYHLAEFTRLMNGKSYLESYPLFFSIVDDVVYLMFGAQTRTKDFDEYALRIDPEFGIFWWYVKSLPRNAAWSESKTRVTTLLGMYFLANY